VQRRFWRSFAFEALALEALLAALWLLSATPLIAPFADRAQWKRAFPSGQSLQVNDWGWRLKS